MLDGSVRTVDIGDIIGYRWGHPECLFDNRAPHEPTLGPDAGAKAREEAAGHDDPR
jgi:hypothetical protein